MFKRLTERKRRILIAAGALLLTIGYLFATSSMAADYVSDSTSIMYSTPTRTTFIGSDGEYSDVHEISSENFNASNYSQINSTITTTYVQTAQNDANAKSELKTASHYGTVTINDHGVYSNAVPLAVHDYSKYYQGIESSSISSTVTLADGSSHALTQVNTIKKAATADSATYTVVPGKTGDYYIYVYYEGGEAPAVNYEVIGNYTAANNFAAGTFSQTLAFGDRPVVGNWWRATVNIGNLSWNGHQVTHTPTSSGEFLGIGGNDKISIDGSELSTLSGSKTFSGNSTEYYNEWRVFTKSFDTYLALNWQDENIHLGHISQGSSLTVTKDTSKGTVQIFNVFGEPLEGELANTVHSPVYIIATPEDDTYSFKMNDANYNEVAGHYQYEFETAATLANEWTLAEVLPTVRVSHGDTSTVMDFYKAPNFAQSSNRPVSETYTLTAEFPEGSEGVVLNYTVSGENPASGTLTSAEPSITVTATWSNAVVTISPAEDTSKQIRFTANKTNVGNPVAKIGNTMYYYLEDAIMNAADGQTIVAIRDVSFYTGTPNPAWTNNNAGYTIKAGVTLLVPYSDDDQTVKETTYTDTSGGYQSTYIHANATFISDQYDNGKSGDHSVEGILEPETSVTRTLTIPAGITVHVNGASGKPGRLVIGGTIVSGTVATGGICGATAGAHANVQLEGTLNINSDGLVSCCGYILGKGKVNVYKGGNLYQPFVITDHCDGHMVANSGSNGNNNFCFARYTMQNVQTEKIFHSGGNMYGYVAVFTQKTDTGFIGTFDPRYNVTCKKIIGSGTEEALFKLDNGTMTMTYDPDKVLSVTSSTDNNTYGHYNNIGRTTMAINGDFNIGNIVISVTLPVLNEQSLDSAVTTMPLAHNYNIQIESGKFTLDKKIAILPGCEVTIGEQATMEISEGGSLSIYRGLRDYSKTVSDNYPTISLSEWHRYHYPSGDNLKAAGFSATGVLKINGTLTVKSGGTLAGTVQTDGESGTIVMEPGSNNTNTAAFGITTGGRTGTNPVAGKTTYELKAEAFLPSGQVMSLEAGNTYNAYSNKTNTLTSYTYKMYFDSAHTGYYYGVGQPSNYVDSNNATQTAQVAAATTLNAPVTGTWIPEIVLDGTTLDVEGEILLNMKFIISDKFLNNANAYAVITEEGNEVVGDARSVTYTSTQIKESGVDDEGRYELSCGIAAGEMTGNVTVEFYDGTNAEPLYIYVVRDGSAGTSVTRTVAQYAGFAFDSSKTDAKTTALKNMCYTMLNFGSDAQVFYETHTSKPASASLPTTGYESLASEVAVDNINIIQTATTTQTGDIDISAVSQLVNLDSEIYLRIYFAPESDIGTYTFELTKPISNAMYLATETLTATDAGDGLCYVDIVNIPPAYWDDTYTITVTNESGSYVVETSVLAWVKQCIAQSDDEAEKNMAIAMFYYNKYAQFYFDEN